MRIQYKSGDLTIQNSNHDPDTWVITNNKLPLKFRTLQTSKKMITTLYVPDEPLED